MKKRDSDLKKETTLATASYTELTPFGRARTLTINQGYRIRHKPQQPVVECRTSEGTRVQVGDAAALCGCVVTPPALLRYSSAL
jgi:predicted cupin superfamily sugar epimerase